MTKTTDEIERDAERTRADLAATLEELRSRTEPGYLVDRAFSYARNNGGADFARNAATQARDNPLPILLIGAGLAWLMSGRRPASGPSAGSIRDAALRKTHDAQDFASGAAGAVGNAASGVAGAVGSAASGVADAVSSAMSSVAGAASSVSDGARGAFQSGRSGAGHVGSTVGEFGSAASDGVRRGGAQAQDAFGRLQSMFSDNPVAMGALGVAIGAAIGAALPATETEGRLIGAQADELKSTLKETAGEQMERAKRAVNAGLEEARQDGGESSDKARSDTPGAA